jgi:hypothetical protein
MPPFAFGRIAHLLPGNLVYLADRRGRQSAWWVTRVIARPKNAGVDPAAFAGPAGSRELVLVTCGGEFDPAARSYQDNVYVYAMPALPAPSGERAP